MWGLWERFFSQNSRLCFIICGSVSSWIEENILSSTGFVGRVSLNMVLHELPLRDCEKFWGKKSKRISPYEKLKVLAVTGGVPRYLEEIQENLSAEENIKQLCFQKEGILFNEFENMFSDLFSRRNEIYRKIISFLVSGKKERKEIVDHLHWEEGGGCLTKYLRDLGESGFLSHDHSWRISTGNILKKISLYRLSDNYVRFYLKYILPNREKIEKDLFQRTSLLALPAWNTIMGLQFENLVIANKDEVLEILEIDPMEIVMANSYLQSKTMRQEGCQIDYLIQTRFNTLYLCEIKFSKNKIGREVVQEVENKMKKLKIPKNYSIRPVLIYAGDVTDELVDSGFFDKIIDFGQFFTNSSAC